MTCELLHDTYTPLWQPASQNGYFDMYTLREYHMAETNEDYEDRGRYCVSCDGLAIEAADRITNDPSHSKTDVLVVLSEYFLAQQRKNFPIEETSCYEGIEYKSAEANNLVLAAATTALAGEEVYGSEKNKSNLDLLISAAKEAEDFYLAGTLLALDVLGKRAALLASLADSPRDIEYELGTIDSLTIEALFAFYQAKGFETVRPQFNGTSIASDIDSRIQEVSGYLIYRNYRLAPNPHLRNAFFAAIL